MALFITSLGDRRAIYITGPDAIGQKVTVGRKTVCFDFDERFGPLVVDRTGEPTERQPISEDAAFWPPFEVWLAGYWKAKGDGKLPEYLKANDGTIPAKPLRYPGRSHPGPVEARSVRGSGPAIGSSHRLDDLNPSLPKEI